eukprot:2386204-Prymnesium_polylepis.1
MVLGLTLVGLGGDNLGLGIAVVPVEALIWGVAWVQLATARHVRRKDAIVAKLREQAPDTDGIKEACEEAF